MSYVINALWCYVISGIMTYINASSVKLYVKIQNVCTVLKVGVCLIIIGGGLYELCRGKTSHFA